MFDSLRMPKPLKLAHQRRADAQRQYGQNMADARRHREEAEVASIRAAHSLSKLQALDEEIVLLTGASPPR